MGTDPDPRFTFANERTFLAWNRTALALIAGGLAAARFLRFGGGLITLSVAVALIAFGGYMSVTSYRHWQRTERALRLRRPPPPSALPRFLAGGVSAAAIAAAGLAVLLYAGK